MPETDYKRSKTAVVINPYTFIPINPREKTKRENAEEVYGTGCKLHTGVLRCSLYVKTPLASPDTAADHVVTEKNGHKRYVFTRNGGYLEIAGSAIRGAVRSVYETMTGSCFATLKEDTSLSKRVDSRRAYKPGILTLENGVYKLYRAKRYLLMVKGCKDVYEHRGAPKYGIVVENGRRKILAGNEKMEIGTSVVFQSTPSKHQKRGFDVWDGIVTDIRKASGNRSGMQSGILYIGEFIGNKHGESVFERAGELRSGGRPVDSDTLKRAYRKLLDVLEVYRNESINNKFVKNGGMKDHAGYGGYEEVRPEDGVPVWYELDARSGEIHLSPASIGRTMYQKSLNELAGDKNFCHDRTRLCEACMLFGMVAGKDGKSLGSHVRVSDAFGTGEFHTENATLKELGMPRYSYLPFYAKAGSRASQNSVQSYDAEGVEISGRKFYWHNKKVLETKSYQTDIKNKRNSTMELVMPDSEGAFRFDVYYDSITDEQLKKLIWAINLGENSEDSMMCHKIGHGKPLGLGSVKIVIDGCLERSVSVAGYIIENREEILESTSEDRGIVTPENHALMESLKKVLNMAEPFASPEKNAHAQIEYPDVLDAKGDPIAPETREKNNNVARHRWYSSNRSGVGGSVQTLPKVSDANQTISQYSYIGDITDTGGRSGYRGGNRGNSGRGDRGDDRGKGGASRGNGRENGGNDNRGNEREHRNGESGYSDGGFSNTPFAGLKLGDFGTQRAERKNSGNHTKNGKKRR